LFYINEIAGVPVFGLGWLLFIWIAIAAVMLGWQFWRDRGSKESKDKQEDGTYRELLGLVQFFVVGAVILVFLPSFFAIEGLGIPIRGYGVMMMFGVMAGVSAAVYRARQVNIDPERIFTLLIWFFVAGIGGARIFFVVQYRQTFESYNWRQTIVEVFRFTEGGLVVYGALLGAIAAFLLFTRRYRIPPLRLADVIAPGLMAGLALGRIGCLLNGCCFGGLCDAGSLGITFPQYSTPEQHSAPEQRTYSPPYQDQLVSGILHGIRVDEEHDGQISVVSVEPGSAAAAAGVEAGTTIKAINGTPVSTLRDSAFALFRAGPDLALIDTAGHAYRWSIGAMPERSRTVQPAQLYSAVNAFLIFLIGWLYFPRRRRDGEVFGVVMVLYPVTRILLEVIRVDELGRFGTPLTISQWVSLMILAAMIGYWYLVAQQSGLHNAHKSNVN
jgi:phosphatidylglycerol:prolipoprotein diacylglycerol transferase